MAIARDNLCGNRFYCQPERLRHVFLDRRVDIGKCADRARYRARCDFGACRDKARTAPGEFGISLGQFLAKCRGFGVNAVAAANRRRIFVFECAGFDRGQQLVDLCNQQVGRARQLDAERGIEHVGTGHALMHEPRFWADLLRDPVQERDHIVLGHRLDRVDRGDIDHWICGPPIPQRLGRAGWHDAQFGQLVGRVRLDLEPDAITRFCFPDCGHLRAGITGDHGVPYRIGSDPCAATG